MIIKDRAKCDTMLQDISNVFHKVSDELVLLAHCVNVKLLY